MSAHKRLLYALAVSLALHVLFFIALFGGEGGRSGPLKVPGLLFVELLNLTSRGAEASITPEPTAFAQRIPEASENPEPEPAPALNVERHQGEEPVRERKTAEKTTPAGETPAGLRRGEPSGEEAASVSLNPAPVGRPGASALPRGAANPAEPELTPPKCAGCQPPSYPAEAQQRGVEGVVVLRVEVLSDGRVGDIFVISSSGFPILDDAALERVKSWTFQPATEDGEPVSDIYQVRIPFVLPQR